MGIEIRLPTVSPQPYTRLAFEGLEFAKQHGRADAYNSAVMRAFFQQSLDIGDGDVLANIANDVGLDAAEFRQALQTGKHSQRHQELLRHAYQEAGVTGVPLFIIGSRTLAGLQSQEALRAAIDQEILLENS